MKFQYQSPPGRLKNIVLGDGKATYYGHRCVTATTQRRAAYARWASAILTLQETMRQRKGY